MNFGALNIRSLENKLETLLQVRYDQLIDMLFLVETPKHGMIVTLSASEDCARTAFKSLIDPDHERVPIR